MRMVVAKEINYDNTSIIVVQQLDNSYKYVGTIQIDV